MLSSLELRDFAIVEAAQIDLGPGLCVLTGETGAGKSIVIDAIGALVGGRAGADLVRSGAKLARLRAAFDLTDAPQVPALLDELGFEPDPDGILIITREIRVDGRSRCTVNGSVANVASLRRLGEALVDIHGQHEHQSLLRPGAHLGLLDALGGPELQAAYEAYAALHDEWREVCAALARLAADDDAAQRRRERLAYDLAEIEAATPSLDEEASLRAERALLANTEQRLAAAEQALAALAPSEDDTPAASELVERAAQAAAELAEVDAELAPLAEELAGVGVLLDEAVRTLQRYALHIEADPARLEWIEDRLALLSDLCRKHGGDLAQVLATAQEAAAELAELDGGEGRMAQLEARRGELEPQLLAAGAALSAARRAAGQRLAEAVVGHLADLHLRGTQFTADLESATTLDAAGPRGLDRLEFGFSANPGEPPRSLARIASGGEISRLMLALKSELAARDDIPTMIFDEIDVGIGGVTIGAVAAKMAALAGLRQVIVVTHHAPIAARADCHLALEKTSEAASTTLSVRRLDDEARVQELARMLGRKPPTEATLSMARELLAEARP